MSWMSNHPKLSIMAACIGFAVMASSSFAGNGHGQSSKWTKESLGSAETTPTISDRIILPFYDSSSAAFVTLRSAIANHEGKLVEQPSDLVRIITKAAAFEIFSSALEAGLFVAFYGGAASTLGGVFILTLTTSTVVYVAHEYFWNYLTPPGTSPTDPELIVAKSVTYRAISILRSFAIGNALGGTGDASTAASFSIVLAALDTVLYGTVEYSIERLFSKQHPAVGTGTELPNPADKSRNSGTF